MIVLTNAGEDCEQLEIEEKKRVFIKTTENARKNKEGKPQRLQCR